ncbi:tryptophan 7-halogenase [Aestuariibacter halophilus]|uniref:Tryptophan 7-halogenase n=1 Tax=Fluctibacter halophilus TaxID=226011 RepID=A0ABS8GFB1_9ALTE|nr:tryptophan halogenase family protein [Aestuariibacter halophilus]MCC2617881.1 tryptophan 7-halogenase [Aestuariibacter halophilus]
MTSSSPFHVVIVGGGSAGWLTAGLLAARFGSGTNGAYKFTLIESPDVPTIGVGEGTWPSMRNTLQQIGIREGDFLRQCHASFKQGSQFIGWRNGADDDRYYHPFTTPLGYGQLDLHAAWARQSTQSFAEWLCPQVAVSEAGCAPKQLATPDYAGVTNYGYHLDAGQFSRMLEAHCTKVLGVDYLQDHVNGVRSHSNGDIAALDCAQHGELSGDLFIDCSGMTGLLIDQHYGVPWLSQKSVLFNDRAVAAQVPYVQPDQDIVSTTLSTAQAAGWIWDIGLQHRRGTGYTYSSNHCDQANAEATLRDYLALPEDSEVSFRHLSFTPGYREQMWVNNCVAIGMSSGFIEPLEASALAMVELSATMLGDDMPRDHQHMKIVRERFNQRFRYRWERVIEFLKLHYVLSQRTEPYWQQNRNPDTIPERLQTLLSLWSYQPPNRHDFIQNEEVFPSASYQYVLYGMGFTTQPAGDHILQRQQSRIADIVASNQQQTQRLLGGLPSNRALLDAIVAQA